MTRYLARRLGLLVPTLLGISVLVFVLMRLIPGDVVQVMLGTEAQLGPEQRQTLYRLFGLDVPLHVQYFRWLVDLLRGDLGVSLRTAEPVTRVIAGRLPITLELALLAALLSWVLAVPLGVIAAIRRDGPLDAFAHVRRPHRPVRSQLLAGDDAAPGHVPVSPLAAGRRRVGRARSVTR